MQRKQLLLTFLVLLVSGQRANATTFTVKAGGGGNFTTISACINAMSASGGDTCVVSAGTYAENLTLKSGTVGNYNILTVNPADACAPVGIGNSSPTCGVIVNSVTMASHTKLSGFEITNTPHATCITLPAVITDAFITSNYLFSCGGGGVGSESGMISGTANGGADTASFIYINTNTLKTSCSPGWNCSMIEIVGDHFLIENNDMSDSNDWIEHFGKFIIARNNAIHDAFTSHCQLRGSGGGSSNCHGDVFESEPVTSYNLPSIHTLFEGNVIRNLVSDGGVGGSAFHGFLLQGDGCTGLCDHSILRFNVWHNIQGYFALNNLTLFGHVHAYNEVFTVGGVSNDVSGAWSGGVLSGVQTSNLKNSIEYLYASNDTPSSYGASFCYSLSGSCAAPSTANLIKPGTSPFANYPADFHLAAGSAAIGAGSSFTNATGSGAASTLLIVADATYFQDGWGFPAGTGVGQVSPDWIRIGASTTVQISTINYSTNVITLANPVSWNSGDPIYLYKNSTGTQVLFGANPDMGAFPSGSSQSQGPNPPTGLQAVVH